MSTVQKAHVEYNVRNMDPLMQRKFNTITHGLMSLSYMVSKLENELSRHMKENTTLEETRKSIKTWDGPYHCSKYH